MGFFKNIFVSSNHKEVNKIEPLASKVLSLESKYASMSDSDLKNQTSILKNRLANGETLDDILQDAFAVVREASFRTLNMKHFKVQIIGGVALHQGRIAEMRTGEGKTLVATLPAYLNCLSGKGVHIVTVNDYLAKRDSEWMGKIYSYLGISVGVVISGMTNDQKRDAYNCDITYGTNNEYGFDYLRDNMVIYKSHKVQRDFNFAIIDEIDSILIDEARTPLIISGHGDKSTDLYKIADSLASKLTYIKVKELNNKQDNDEEVDVDYIVDEKAKTATLTKHGILKVENYFNIDNLNDSENLTIHHHINQAIKAHSIMIKDIDYILRDDKVVIVDEFTGRLMEGRRYSDGLHQAIEAKENVKVERESKTLATITFQNYFRLYKKLSGMTGTALTEENEFREIYNLDVVVIPTNNEVRRKDHNDLVYKTETAKYMAAVEMVHDSYQRGQPVLLGTVSIEVSEYLSSLLSKRGVKHNVLNAKNHAREAEIIAQAGKFKAVTIATNMAGRGTDIVLGGNPEYMAKNELRKMGFSEDLIVESDSHGFTDDSGVLEVRRKYLEFFEKFKAITDEDAVKVKESGGLLVIGTERHESRRIDNQLRGRSGRQGDKGETIFYLSLEDDLMRLFGGERIYNLMEKLNVDEDVPIENRIITSQIENAQKKIEGRNFASRKSVLGFDDVMNVQRRTIYSQRAKVLDNEDIKPFIETMIKESITKTCESYVSDSIPIDDWNLEGLKDFYLGVLTNEGDFDYNPSDNNDITASDIKEDLIKKALDLYQQKEEKITSDIMREAERVILLNIVDRKWTDHIDSMDELKRGIYLRSYAQHDPITEYRIEGFDMFDSMIDSIKDDTMISLLTFEFKNEENIQRKEVIKIESEGFEDLSKSKSSNSNKSLTLKSEKIGRNQLCICGSGKKYKKCCGF